MISSRFLDAAGRLATDAPSAGDHCSADWSRTEAIGVNVNVGGTCPGWPGPQSKHNPNGECTAQGTGVLCPVGVSWDTIQKG